MAEPDDQLFDEAARGDAQALDQLLQRYLPQLRAFVQARLGPQLRARESSGDVVQSVCREALEQRERFDFRGEERFRAWLFTVALNKLRERHRRLHSDRRDIAREQPIEDPDAVTALAQRLTPSQLAVGNETARTVEAALAALSAAHREVIVQARVLQLPHRVIAELSGRSEVAARQLLARAMLGFARELRRRGVDLDRTDPS